MQKAMRYDPHKQQVPDRKTVWIHLRKKKKKKEGKKINLTLRLVKTTRTSFKPTQHEYNPTFLYAAINRHSVQTVRHSEKLSRALTEI